MSHETSSGRRRTVPAGGGRKALAVGVALMATIGVTAGQRQQPPPPSQSPTFRSGVDVVIVEATVVDRSGGVAKGLTSADFQVEIGGRAREVVSADLVEYHAAPPAGAVAAPDVSTNTQVSTSRTILFVADQGSLGTDSRTVIDSARRWLKTLSPTDRVGLVALPPPGPRVEFTTNHAQVSEAFGKIVPAGGGPSPAGFSQRNVGLSEAIAINEGDMITRGRVVERECRPSEPMCPQEIDAAAQDLAIDAQMRMQPTLAAMVGLLHGMRVLSGPKHVVLLSAGWPLNERYATTQIEPLAAAASRANVTVHALLAERSGMDASISRPSPSLTQDRDMMLSAVETLSGWTGGQSARVVGTGDAAFKALSGVLAGYYRLGVRPEGSDLDGKTRRINVKVTRPGVSIRAHRRVMMSPPKALELTKADPAAALREAIRSETPLTGLNLRATSYVLHEAVDAPARLRIIVVGDINGATAGAAKLRLALYDQNGKPVSGGDVDLTIPEKGPAGMSGALSAPPGIYVLRLAVRDGAGRVGSLERNVDLQWRDAGGVQTTGLALFHVPAAAGSAPEPVLDVVKRNERLVAQIAFSAPKAGAPEPTVTIEVTREGASAPLLRLPVRAGRLAKSPRRLAQEALPISLLPPGRYSVAAVVAPGIPPLSRSVVIESDAAPAADPTPTAEAAAATPAPAAPAAPTAILAPLTLAKPPRFDISTMLAPAQVSPILEQLGNRVGDAGVREALAQVKAGPWPIEAAKGPLASAPVAGHFVAGLGRLHAGDLEGAAEDFRSALRAAPDFAPAMAYLAACYAAGGKDKEAASAWQTALLRDRNAPWLQRLAIEAWLRAERPTSALALIKQARQRFPDDDSFVALQARAELASGRAREGLEVVESLKAPDESLLLMALATLYTAARERAPVWDAARDLEAMKRWREAYAAAKGGSLPLVDAWLAEITLPPQ